MNLYRQRCTLDKMYCWYVFLSLDPLAAVLLVAKRSQIIANRINMRPPQMRPVISGSSIVTVDFDRMTSRIYWADASQKKIWSSFQNATDRREVRESKRFTSLVTAYMGTQKLTYT